MEKMVDRDAAVLAEAVERSCINKARVREAGLPCLTAGPVFHPFFCLAHFCENCFCAFVLRVQRQGVCRGARFDRGARLCLWSRVHCGT